MPWKIPLSDIDFGPEEEAAALRVIRSRWLSMGAETEAFERSLPNTSVSNTQWQLPMELPRCILS